MKHFGIQPRNEPLVTEFITALLNELFYFKAFTPYFLRLMISLPSLDKSDDYGSNPVRLSLLKVRTTSKKGINNSF